MSLPNSIPTIDISPYLDPDTSTPTKLAVVDNVRLACEQYGFLQVIGHGVPLSTQRDILQCCKTLFDLPKQQKQALSLKNNPARRSINSNLLHSVAGLMVSEGTSRSANRF